MRTKLTVKERIKRATKIREGKEKLNATLRAQYIQSTFFKFKKLIAFFFLFYILLTLVPYYPSCWETQEIIISDNFYMDKGAIIIIKTNNNKEYEIKGKSMGNHAFHGGDTVVVQKNLVYKTKNIYHKKYSCTYPIDKQVHLFIIFASFVIVLIILVLSQDYRMVRFHNNITLITLIFFLIYLTS